MQQRCQVCQGKKEKCCFKSTVWTTAIFLLCCETEG